MCYDIHSRWNLVRRFFWHARRSIPVQTFFNTIMLQIREVDSDSSWSNIIEPPKKSHKKCTEKIRFSSVDSQNLVSNKKERRSKFPEFPLPLQFPFTPLPSPRGIEHEGEPGECDPCWTNTPWQSFHFLRSKGVNRWNMIYLYTVVVRFRNSCFGMLNFSFQKNHWKIPFVSITPVGTSAVSARPSPSIICPCGPRMATTPSLAALAWYGWRAFRAELGPPKHEHEKSKQPNNPHFLYSKQLFQTTQAGNRCLILQTTLNPHTGFFQTPEMPWSKDYKWLKTAWSCHFHMIVWGFIDPEVAKPPKKKQTFQNPIGFFIVPKSWDNKTPLEIKSCTPPPAQNKQKMYVNKKKLQREYHMVIDRTYNMSVHLTTTELQAPALAARLPLLDGSGPPLRQSWACQRYQTKNVSPTVLRNMRIHFI